MEDWEVMDSSPDSTEKALKALSSYLLKKVVPTAAGTVGWVFLTALKANIESTLCDATPVCNVQRSLEELDRRILVLEQEPRGPEEPSISDREVVSDGDDEHHETVGPRLAARPVVQQKVKCEQPKAKEGGHAQGTPV